MKGLVKGLSPSPAGSGAGELQLWRSSCWSAGALCGEHSSPSLPPSLPLLGELPAVFLGTFSALGGFLLLLLLKGIFHVKEPKALILQII